MDQDAPDKNYGGDDNTSMNIGVPWYINKAGELHIGSGDLANDGTVFGPSFSNEIKTIHFDGKVTAPADGYSFFANLANLTNIYNIDKFDVSNVNNMNSYFQYDPSLVSLDLSSWNTSNVTDMSYMFQGDTSLENLNISNFNTSNVTSMDGMLDMINDGTSDKSKGRIKSLDISNWNVQQLRSAKEMFRGNSLLSSLNINDWNPQSLITFDSMFKNDPSLTSLNLSSWTTPALASMVAMFQNDTSLTDLDISNFNVSENSDFSFLFFNDKSLKGIDLSKWHMMGTDDKSIPNVGSDDPNYFNNMFGKTNMDYIILGSHNYFAIDPSSNLEGITLPSEKSKTGTWYNTDQNTIQTSFSATDIATSIGKFYNGTHNPKEIYTFVPNLDITADVAIPSNIGDQTVKDIKGQIGQTVSVNVPTVDGYTADKKTVDAKVNPDGTITTDEKVTYTKITPPSTGSNSSHHNNSNNNDNDNNKDKTTIEHKNQTVAVYNNEDNVPLYSRNSDGEMVTIQNHGLARNSTWFSNQQLITINNESYYQVATNEYVKADQVYPYNAVNLDIRTNNDSNKILFNAHGDKVINRGLAANSNWFTDRVIELNGTKYYRVATDEFVNANDVFVYKTLD